MKEKWNTDLVYEKAAECRTKSDFEKKYSGAFKHAKRNGYLNELCQNVFGGIGKQSYWNAETIMPESQKYDTITAFEIGSPGAYGAAYRLGLLDTIRSEMKSPYLPRGYWDDEKLAKEMGKYETIKEFRTNSPNACAAWYRRPDKEKFKHLLKPVGNYYRRHVYRIIDTEKREVYVGLTCNLKNRQQSHRTQKMGKIFGPNLVLEDMTGLLPAVDAQRIEQMLIDCYKNLGYTVHNVVRGGGLGGTIPQEPISKSECLTVAAKYQYRTDLYNANIAVWATIKRNGWEKEAFAHMPRRRSEGRPRKWSPELCISGAQKHPDRISLMRASIGCYNAIRRQGLQEVAYAHMGKPWGDRRRG